MTALTLGKLEQALDRPVTVGTAAATDRVSFGVGPVDVAVRCPRRAVVRDLGAFYKPAANDGRPLIRIEAWPERWRPWRCRIHADAAPVYRNVGRAELLPYIEWAINGRIIDRCRQYLFVHAATLSWRGRGVVFAAPSGSGKSTLAATLLSRGWQHLCDEYAMIHLQSRQLQPLPRAICVKAGSFDVVEQLGLPLRRDHHHAKAFKGEVGYLVPDDVGPQALAASAVPVAAVVFPRYLPGAAPRTEPLAPADAVMQLASHALNRQWLGHRATELLAEVADQATCLRLAHGDAGAAGSMLETLLDRL